MNVISGLRNSGFLAQSAYSAAVATKDNLGRDITSTYLTSHQDLSDYQTIAGMTAYQEVGDYYSASNPSGFITGVDLSPYYTTADANTLSSILSGAIDYVSANAGDQEVHNIVHTNSATWDSVTNKLDTTAFSEVSSTFLTAHQSLDGYATETLVEETSGAITSLIPTDYYPDTNPSGFISGVDLTPYQTIEGMTAYQPVGEYYSASNPSGFITGVDLTPYYTTAEANSLSSMLSGAIDYVSANAGDGFPASANEAITAYQTNSSTYLTAISIPESATWNDVSTTVQTNSATWGQGGDVSLPISGTDGYFSANLDTTGLSINTEDSYDASYGYKVTVSHNSQHVEIGYNYIEINDGGTETIEVQTIRDLTSVSSTVSTNSASWNEVSSTVNTNSASWNDVSSKQDNLTFGYDGQDKISSINNSGIAGVGSLDIFPISGTGSVNVYEQTNVLWVSGKDFTSDISYISGTIGDVETLLASL